MNHHTNAWGDNAFECAVLIAFPDKSFILGASLKEESNWIKEGNFAPLS